MLSKLLAVGGAFLLLVLAASSSAAAPTYTGWSTPVNLGPVVNSAAPDFGPALSADGLSLFFNSGRPGGFGGNDIWVTHRTSLSTPWGVPANVGPTVNTAAAETVPALSADGHWMFFGSDRPGGFGGTDLYQSFRADVHDDFGWQTPTNLGANVNSAVEENGAGYFDNGGHPQLYFGSNRPGAAGTDIYRSDRQADGSWGPAAPVPELNSQSTENRFNIRQDGLEVFFYSDRAGTFGGTDLWVATRASTDSPWSTPVNVGSTINTSANDQHPSLSADGRTLIFGSNRAGGSGLADLYVTTRNAELTVTANDQSRLFGQANPALTYTITGFVGGETSAVVSGTASCTTTAMPFSPAGDYPITCTVGTLGAAGYAFATFVAGKLTVSYSEPCLTAPHAGALNVAAGQAICIGAGATQAGPVTVQPGGSLDVEGGSITGPLTATGAAAVRLCGMTLTGPLTISGSTGLALVGGDTATGPCDPSSIAGPARVTGNTGGVEFNGNTVVGPLRITGNTGVLPPPDTGPVHADGNTVTGPATIQS
jgi:hypothetical protein